MKISFEKRTLNGIPYECKKADVTLTECLAEIERLYQIYKYSVPSQNDDRRTYFYALPASELTDAQLVCGANRAEVRKELELYVLSMIVSGVLKWDTKVMKGNWFWKGNDPDLVILRSWID